jgi:outer membrane protein OmpA-like peptidoglycan-associated protein
MRTLTIGIIAFILWTILCTWYYLNHIKSVPADEAIQTEQSGEMAPAADDMLESDQDEAILESPGNYTVYHAFDRSEILADPNFDSYIEQLKAFIGQAEGTSLNVIGHADHIGSENYNFNLGSRRSGSTKDYLVKMGVTDQVIKVSSRGESAPAASNDTDEGRAKNRRTEIQIVN